MKTSQLTALIIDDEVQIRRLLRAALESEDYRVVEAEAGSHGISEVALSRPDVIVLDLGLPDMDGAEVLRRIREWSRVPVLVASVREDSADKIAALNAGADDYVTKPFDTAELLARLRAIQRRADPAKETAEFIAGDLRIDYVKRLVTVKGAEARLTPIEYALLRILALNAGKVVTQKILLREVWGPQGEAHGEYLRVHLTHLRKKIETTGQRLIRTESGIGYRLMAEAK